MSESGSTSSRARSRSPAATSPSSCSRGRRVRRRTLTRRPARRIRSLRRWRRRPSCSTPARTEPARGGHGLQHVLDPLRAGGGDLRAGGRTRRLVAAARRAGARRVVHVSVAKIDLVAVSVLSAHELRPRTSSASQVYSYTRSFGRRLVFGPDDVLVNNVAGVSATYRSFSSPARGARTRCGSCPFATRLRSASMPADRTRTSSRCRGAVSLDVRRFRAADRARRGQPSMDHACAGGGRAVRGAARRVGVEGRPRHA